MTHSGAHRRQGGGVAVGGGGGNFPLMVLAFFRAGAVLSETFGHFAPHPQANTLAPPLDTFAKHRGRS